MIRLSANELALIAINGFGAMQKPFEFGQLLNFLEVRFGKDSDDRDRAMLEIGMGRGGSTWAFSKLDFFDLLVGVDLPGGPWGGGPTLESVKYIAGAAPEVDVHWISGNSMNSECLREVEKKLLGRRLDFLFIDGDHSYAGVKTDFLTYSPFVGKGGVIAFHDICEHDRQAGCEVNQFWAELKDSWPKEHLFEFIDAPKTWGGIGVLVTV